MNLQIQVYTSYSPHFSTGFARILSLFIFVLVFRFTLSFVSRFGASLPLSLRAYSSNALAASYASTLGATSIWPRKARREPICVYAFEASLTAFAHDTPPFAFA